ILGISIFPEQFFNKNEQVLENFSIKVETYEADKRYMKVFVPDNARVIETMKRLSHQRYSKTRGCYLMPATPEMMTALKLHFSGDSA
ncbi:MAG: hypothetical protein ABR595_07365, partial [Psychroflexus sp.]